MPVHLLWGMTRDADEITEDVSIYRPITETEHPVPAASAEGLEPSIVGQGDTEEIHPITETVYPIPDVDTEELRPTIITEDEDPCN